MSLSPALPQQSCPKRCFSGRPGNHPQPVIFFAAALPWPKTESTFPARAYTDPEAEQKGVVPASRYAELAKAYLELEQAYAAAMLKCGREKQLEDTLAETRNILAGILTSLSWRVTAPLRKLMEIIRRR